MFNDVERFGIYFTITGILLIILGFLTASDRLIQVSCIITITGLAINILYIVLELVHED